MLIKKEDTRKKENSSSCTVREYDFPNKNLGFAIAHINGKYPETGKVVNHICDEMYYVLGGEGTIYQETGTYAIQEGDCFLIEKGTRYKAEGKNLKIAVPTSPARSLEQYENIDD